MVRVYVLGFAFRHDKSTSLLLIKKAHPDWQAGKLNGIGGHMEIGETPYTAMSREFEEETGVKIPPLSWRKFGEMSGPGGRFENHGWLVHLFAYNGWEVDQFKTLTDEEVVMVDKDHLPPNLMHNLPWLIPMAYDALHNGMNLSYEVKEN